MDGHREGMGGMLGKVVAEVPPGAGFASLLYAP